MVVWSDVGTHGITRKVRGENVVVQKVRDPKQIAHKNTHAVTSNLCQGKAQHSE